MSLLEDLKAALPGPSCTLCAYINDQDGELKEALTSAAAGTIGRDKLVAILKRNGTGIGRRTLERHRREGHQP